MKALLNKSKLEKLCEDLGFWKDGTFSKMVASFAQSEIERNRKNAVRKHAAQIVFLCSALNLVITILKEIKDYTPKNIPLPEAIELVENIIRNKGNKAFEISDEGSEIE